MTIEQATWAALEGVAKQAGVSMSGLAIGAGRDATTFNASKRCINGKDRSPTVASVFRACQFAGVSIVDFARAIEDHMKPEEAPP